MQQICSASGFCLLSFAFISGFIDSACAVQYGPYPTTAFRPFSSGTTAFLPSGNKCDWDDNAQTLFNTSTYAQSQCALINPNEYTCYSVFQNYEITSTLTSTVRGVPLVASGIVGVAAVVVASNEYQTNSNKDPNSFYRGTLVIDGWIKSANDLTSVVIPAGSGPTSFDVGGPSTLWGESLTPNQVRNIGFGFAISFAGTGNGTGNAQKVRLHYASVVVTWSMPPVNAQSISPATGPAAGGTLVTVVSATPSFIDLTPYTGESTPLCRFGSVSVTATVASDQSLTCIAPPGSGTVSLEISLDGAKFTNDGETFTYYLPVTAITTGIRTMTSAEGETSVLSSGAPSNSAQSSSISFTSARDVTSTPSSTGPPTLALTQGTESSSPEQSAAATTTSGIVQAVSTESGSAIVMIVAIFIAVACFLVAVTVVATVVIRQQKQSSSPTEVALSSKQTQVAGSSDSPFSSMSVGSQAYAPLSCLPIDHANAIRPFSASSTYDTMPRRDDVQAPLQTSLPVLPPPVPYDSTILVMKALHTFDKNTDIGAYAAMPAEAHETLREHRQ